MCRWPSSGGRPGSVTSTVPPVSSASSAFRLSASCRSANASSSLAFTSFAACPYAGRSSRGSLPMTSIAAASAPPLRLRYRTRQASSASASDRRGQAVQSLPHHAHQVLVHTYLHKHNARRTRRLTAPLNAKRAPRLRDEVRVSHMRGLITSRCHPGSPSPFRRKGRSRSGGPISGL